MGGNFNADTRQTMTQYLFTVPADDLDAALHIESPRMRGLLATEQDWDHERGAIEQEVAQVLNELFFYGTQRFDRAVELLAENEMHLTLREQDFNVVRRQIGRSVAGRLKSPNYLSDRALLAALFPRDDPTLRTRTRQQRARLALGYRSTY